ncbi:response regulator [Allosediminivita pacifica]|uniref:Response regulator receiver domain-containing protein n=1 Tax=Allosediminivita pacifica TaxID=1267769 RepID=A0A2T6AXA0_9RHOB|nr:response regulator [Allosediminivita pacifica]PTX48429.1 response regulator receiver domain-containing protein [Allosediminivita pacifica]GGB10559.1 response regulator [Allosediminivita pacifica]
MDVLIIESRKALADLWSRHLDRMGAGVVCATGEAEAVAHLESEHFDVVILDLVLEEGSAFAVADYVAYRDAATRIIFVTNTTFFSDGSIFSLFANACAYLPRATPPEDLSAMVEHYARPH